MLSGWEWQKEINEVFKLTYQEAAVAAVAMTELTYLSADQYHTSEITEGMATLRNLVFLYYIQRRVDSHYTNMKVWESHLPAADASKPSIHGQSHST